MAKAPPAVGIDLGTTYSVVAYVDETGRPVTIVNAEGELTTPSVVLLEGGQAIVGKEALKAVAHEAENVADLAKRDLGNRTFRKTIDGRRYPPEAIQAWVLAKIKQDAQQHLGEFTKVVITVPAYFDEVRRKATQDSGYIAGLDVIDIINEPTAAAVAYGFQQGFLNDAGKAARPQKVLVYDLGGGTFDVTVMEIVGSEFKTLATDGDVQLGGRDWDQRIVDYAAEEFIRQHGVDPRDDANAAGRLWRECEDAKRTLSARAKTVIAFDFLGKAVRVDLTRDRFLELTHDLLERTQFTARQTVQAAGLAWADIDRTLLVGGSTRMPMVREMLTESAGKAPETAVSADEAVAHGAALHAALILARTGGGQPNFRVRNVNSHSLGVVATDRETQRKRNATLIPRNTPLPVSAKRVFKTHKPDQKSVLVRIVEGESASPDDCSQIGQCVVRDLPPGLPEKTPIEVRFRYSDNGRLTVAVSVENTGRKLNHEITRENSLSPEQLDSWRQYIASTMQSASNPAD